MKDGGEKADREEKKQTNKEDCGDRGTDREGQRGISCLEVLDDGVSVRM